MMSSSALEHILIVLVEPSHPGNIGASARAMKTMGLSRLALVNPQQYPCAEATARASGADDVLQHAQVYDDLASALQGCQQVIGCSARSREISWPMLQPEQAAQQAFESGLQTAIVFGRERSGLSNEELDHCHYLLQIPSNPDYSSLNLAAAVQVVSYTLRRQWLSLSKASGVESTAQESPHEPADAQAMHYFYQHLQQTLVDIDFLNPKQPKKLMRRLHRLFNRSNPSETELNILRGILRASQNHQQKS